MSDGLNHCSAQDDTRRSVYCNVGRMISSFSKRSEVSSSASYMIQTNVSSFDVTRESVGVTWDGAASSACTPGLGSKKLD